MSDHKIMVHDKFVAIVYHLVPHLLRPGEIILAMINTLFDN